MLEQKGLAFPLIMRAKPEEWTTYKVLSVSPLLTRGLVHPVAYDSREIYRVPFAWVCGSAFLNLRLIDLPDQPPPRPQLTFITKIAIVIT